MKLHLLAIPKDHRKSTAVAFCGRTYENAGPRQPEDKTRVVTACGEESYFRPVLEKCNNAAICIDCLAKVSSLADDDKKRVLVVMKKSIGDKLEEWEAALATQEEIEERINLAVFRLGIFDSGTISFFTGLERKTVHDHLTKLVDEGFISRCEDDHSYHRTEDREKALIFMEKISYLSRKERNYIDEDD